MKQRSVRRTLAVLVAVLAATAAGAADAGDLGLADWIDDAMQAWEVPGLAVAVVVDGEVVLAQGYGVRSIDDGAPVDADTIFAIGSSTKAFTAACVGLLVDSDLLAWDDPVTRRLPGFRLSDPWVTRELTVRDLLTHRSGLPRGDLLWYASGFSRDEILERVAKLEPSWSFRSVFGYQNIMFLAAGQLYGEVAGSSWDECVTRRLFAPLGMTRSSITTRALPGQTNVATPHERIEGKLRTVAWRNLDNTAPAGSINSSVRDMAEWLKLQLAAGEHDGEHILQPATLTEMHTPQMTIRKEGRWALFFPASHFVSYGLGWFVDDYRGEQVVEHGGSIDGMRALVSLVPERGWGLVVLTNRGSHFLPEMVRYRIYDALLGSPGEDWNAVVLAKVAEQEHEAAEARRKEIDGRVAGTSPSLAPAAYVGTYEHEMYGLARVDLEDGRLVLRRGQGFSGALAHWHYDTFEVRWDDPVLGRELVSFRLDAAGRVEALVLPGPGVFARKDD